MPRYFFNIHNGIGDVADQEGLLYADLDAARDQAILSIRAILSDELKATGLVDLRGRIDIVEEDGTSTTVPFDTAVNVRRGD